jgi:ATP-dependent Clp protease ATP-binding subunit ClpA
MFERFSAEARAVIVLAKEEAERFKHERIGTEHLVAALSIGNTNAARILAELGVTTGNIRGQIVELVGHGDKPSPGHLPFTDNTRAVLNEAAKRSLSMGHDHVGTEHLLLAIAAFFPSNGFRALTRSGANPDEVARRIELAMNPAHSPSKDPMELDFIDTSVGKQHLDHKITRTARTVIPQNRQPGRETLLQAVIINAPLEKNCKATVSVLNDQFAWTELLSLPSSEWRDRVPLPDPHGEVDVYKLADVADDLISRAAKMLGA